MENIRVFEAFAGYGSQHLALKRLKRDYPSFDFAVVGISEIDRYAIQAYEALHGEANNYGDISKIDWSEVPDFDLLTYSFPCFVAGTLIYTKNGFMPIEDIQVGYEVYTHTNRLCKVEKVGCKPSPRLYRLKGMMFDEILCTSEHPFYSREMYRKWDNPNRRWVRLFASPKWVAAKDLTKQTYLGYLVNTQSELPRWEGSIDNRWGHHKRVNKLSPLFNEESFWYIMGRYIGDGWKKTNKEQGNGIVICCSERNKESLVNALDSIDFHFTEIEERTVTKLHISMNELHTFVDRYGYYAHGKKIDAGTLNLPTHLLKAFIEGVIDSDGCYTNNEHKVSTVSRELAFGLQQCIAKVYKRPARMYKTTRKKTTIIEGREVNQRDSYTLVWHTEDRRQDKAFYEDGFIWFPIKMAEQINEGAVVYNMQVADDHSYTANGAIVHNCTDISNTGQQQGFDEGSGTRSSLLWECRKAIVQKRPKYLLMENVKAICSKKFMPLFQKWLQSLEDYGYYTNWAVLNAKNYGIPQNRERCFAVSIRRDLLDPNPQYHFPKPFPLESRLKDILEPKVDERYYLSDKALGNFATSGRLNSSQDGVVSQVDGIAPTHTAGHGNCPKIINNG